jgi:hypothetical protein
MTRLRSRLRHSGGRLETNWSWNCLNHRESGCFLDFTVGHIVDVVTAARNPRMNSLALPPGWFSRVKSWRKRACRAAAQKTAVAEVAAAGHFPGRVTHCISRSGEN